MNENLALNGHCLFIFFFLFELSTFAGRPTLSFHHPSLFCIGYSMLDRPAGPKQSRGLEGSGNQLYHPCRENLQTLESSIGTSCWTEL